MIFSPPIIDPKKNFLRVKNVFINTFFISASLGFVGGAYATSQTSSYTLPYVYSPIVSQTPSSSISTMGASGSKGGGADCNKAWEGEGKPSDGGQGGAGLSFVNSLSLPSYSIGSVTSPVPTTAIYTYTLGGTGGVGGSGGSCYSGYGGGKGGVGGAITFTTPGSPMALQTAAIVVLSQGGQGGNGGPTSSTLDAGDGGRGGDGGALNITNNYSITTYGVPPPATPSETTPTYNAFGIFAQSTGGGAGDGGKNSNDVGGSGGSSKPGGAGGDVTIGGFKLQVQQS